MANTPTPKNRHARKTVSGKTPAAGSKTQINRPLQVLASSQLTPNKGHAELLDSLAALKSEGYKFHGHILGAGPEEPALRTQSVRLGLENISWHGLQADVYAFLRRADVFVLPSREEGLPNTLLEAMSQGLIPVARDVGGVKEIWPQTGLDGLLFGFAPGDLTAALKAVFNAEDEQLSAWSNIALEQCREVFNQSVQAQRLYDWYASLVRR